VPSIFAICPGYFITSYIFEDFGFSGYNRKQCFSILDIFPGYFITSYVLKFAFFWGRGWIGLGEGEFCLSRLIEQTSLDFLKYDL
jgi:hypothetical protein